MKRLFYSCLILVAACAKTNFIQLSVVDAGPETVKKLSYIQKDLNELTGCEVIGNSHSDKRRWIQIKIDDNLLINKECGAWGLYDGNNEVIYFQSKLKQDEYSLAFGKVLIHEIGHSLGLEHEPDTVMNEKVINEMTYGYAIENLVELLNKHGKNPCLFELEAFLRE